MIEETQSTTPELTIIQWNCGNSNFKQGRLLFDRLDPKRHHIIALQEPFILKDTQRTYIPPGYHLAVSKNPSTCMAFLVSQEIHIQVWHFEETSPNQASLILHTAEFPIWILNIYNPQPATPHSHTPTALPEVQNTLRRLLSTSENQVILLGDFNLHHPSWGGGTLINRPTCQQAD
jgi:exonuclease III